MLALAGGRASLGSRGGGWRQAVRGSQDEGNGPSAGQVGSARAELLKPVTLAGGRVTPAALGCQTTLAPALVDPPADAGLALTGKHDQGPDAVGDGLAGARPSPVKARPYRFGTTTNQAQARRAIRRCWPRFDPRPCPSCATRPAGLADRRGPAFSPTAARSRQTVWTHLLHGQLTRPGPASTPRLSPSPSPGPPAHCL